MKTKQELRDEIEMTDSIIVKNLGDGWIAHQTTFGPWSYEHTATGSHLSRAATMFDEDGIYPGQWYLYHRSGVAEPVSSATEANELALREQKRSAE